MKQLAGNAMAHRSYAKFGKSHHRAGWGTWGAICASLFISLAEVMGLQIEFTDNDCVVLTETIQNGQTNRVVEIHRIIPDAQLVATINTPGTLRCIDTGLTFGVTYGYESRYYLKGHDVLMGTSEIVKTVAGEVGGLITHNTVWTDTRTLHGPVTVAAGAALEIQPGATVAGGLAREVFVNGTLSADGVTFRGDLANKYAFKVTALPDAVFSLRRCTFELAEVQSNTRGLTFTANADAGPNRSYFYLELPDGFSLDGQHLPHSLIQITGGPRLLVASNEFHSMTLVPQLMRNGSTDVEIRSNTVFPYVAAGVTNPPLITVEPGVLEHFLLSANQAGSNAVMDLILRASRAPEVSGAALVIRQNQSLGQVMLQGDGILLESNVIRKGLVLQDARGSIARFNNIDALAHPGAGNGIQITGTGKAAADNLVSSNRIAWFQQGLLLGSRAHSNWITGNLFVLNGTNVVLGGELNTLPAGNTIVNNRFEQPRGANFSALFWANMGQPSNIWTLPKQAGPNILGGPFLGGNLWTHHRGPDAGQDGIVDRPLLLISNNVDTLPLWIDPTIIVNLSSDEPDAAINDWSADVNLEQDGPQTTLRAAIQEANRRKEFNVIHFNIPETGLVHILPSAPYPAISNQVTLDATTQFQGVWIDGVMAGSNAVGLKILGGQSLISGLTITRFRGTGLQLGDWTKFSGGSNVVNRCNLGTDPFGNTGLGNGEGLVIENSHGNTVGDLLSKNANVISGNDSNGVRISSSQGNRLFGNAIGFLLETPKVIFGKGAGHGVVVEEGSSNIIGAAGSGNLIGGFEGNGILLHSHAVTMGNVIQGNSIGVHPQGTNAGNVGHGILVDGPNKSMIGGIGEGMGNLIAFSLGSGVRIIRGTQNAVLGNRIYDNYGQGIDLGNSGPDINDAGDHDNGPNDLQNYPFVRWTLDPTPRIDGILKSFPLRDYRLEFYRNTECDGSLSNEGREFLGAIDHLATDSEGNVEFFFSTPDSAYTNFTATATVIESDGSFGSTSEFAPCLSHIVVNVATDDPDADPNDGMPDSDLSTPGLQTSLRAALEFANRWPGADAITFDIPGGPRSIWVKHPLPEVIDPVTINGIQPTDDGLQSTEIRADPAKSFALLTLRASGCVISDLTFHSAATNLCLISSSHQIRSCVFSNAQVGVDLIESRDCLLAENVFAKNDVGVRIVGGQSNRIDQSTVVSKIAGIEIVDSIANAITRNKFSDTESAEDNIRIQGESSVGNRVQSNSFDQTRARCVSIRQAKQTFVGGLSTLQPSLSGEGNDFLGKIDLGSSDFNRTNWPCVLISGANATENIVQGNRFRSQFPLHIIDAQRSLIGGEIAGQANLFEIENRGVTIESGTGNRVLGNSFMISFPENVFERSDMLGIDLGLDRDATPNDSGDLDEGANRLQNTPVLQDLSMDHRVLTGSLSSRPLTPFRIEIYQQNSASTGSRMGTFLAGVLTNITTDSTGQAIIRFESPEPLTRALIATATDPDGNTSEFSAPFWPIIVNSTGDDPDSNPRDGLALTGKTLLNGEPECTLRASIEEINALGVASVVKFNIPIADSSPPVIQPSNPLPEIDTPVTIEGTSQALSFRIALNGAHAGACDGLVLRGGQSKITGLDIYGFSGNGLVLRSDGNSIALCRIGNALNLPALKSNLKSGLLISGANQNQIGGHQATSGNVFSGNGFFGVEICEASCQNVIAGNVIGLHPQEERVAAPNAAGGVLIRDLSHANRIGTALEDPGEAALGNIIAANGLHGIEIKDGSTNNGIYGNIIRENTSRGVFIQQSGYNHIGASNACAANTIIANRAGIEIAGADSSGCVIAGNWIGLQEDGPLAGGNQGDGIVIENAQDILVGGSTTLEGNVVSANLDNGIVLRGSDTKRIRVQANLIGADRAGRADPTRLFGNGGSGVLIDQASHNWIGGTELLLGNRIASNGRHGIEIRGATAINNQILGNHIGIDDLDSDCGNLNAGVFVDQAASHNLIGADAPLTAGNDVAFNQRGVVIKAGQFNTVSGNRIFSNKVLGIDLGEDGVTLNDLLDADSGPNQRLNYPLIDQAYRHQGLTVLLKLPVPPGVYQVEFFGNSTLSPSSFGEGRIFLGRRFLTVQSDGGLRRFAATIPTADTGEFVTATATDAQGNTSEFSRGLNIEPGADFDHDGMVDQVEALSLNSGDANNDGIQDSLQPEITTVPVIDNTGNKAGELITLISAKGTQLSGVSSLPAPKAPASNAPPASVQFPLGILSFQIGGMIPGAISKLELMLPPDVPINSYYKFNPQHCRWEKWEFDGSTGAQILADRIVLYLRDGGRGDDDNEVNAYILDPGAPALDSGCRLQFEWSSSHHELQIRCSSIPGQTCRLEQSDDLKNWQEVSTIVASSDVTTFNQIVSPQTPRRFFRVAQVQN